MKIKILILYFLFCSYSIFALQLIPMKFTLKPSGRDSNTTVTIKNQNNETEAVHLFITT
jgi:hypothetical protein